MAAVGRCIHGHERTLNDPLQRQNRRKKGERRSSRVRNIFRREQVPPEPSSFDTLLHLSPVATVAQVLPMAKKFALSPPWIVVDNGCVLLSILFFPFICGNSLFLCLFFFVSKNSLEKLDSLFQVPWTSWHKVRHIFNIFSLYFVEHVYWDAARILIIIFRRFKFNYSNIWIYFS